MKKTLLLFLILLFAAPLLHAQNTYNKLLDTNSVWNYVGCHGPPPYYTTYYKFKQDTVLNGHQYYSLLYSGDSLVWHNFIGSNNTILREDTIYKKVYMLSNYTTEGLLYDFMLETGDSVVVTNTICMGDSITYHVSSVDSIQMNDLTYRKRFNFNYYSWVEGIGTFVGLVHPGCLMVGNCENFVCYYQNAQFAYINPSYNSCFTSNPNDYFNFIDTNKLWNYAETYTMGTPAYTSLFRFKKDTLINGLTYYIAESTADSVNWHNFDGYFREDNKKVFILHNGIESLMYDFKAYIGDTLQIFHHNMGNPVLCPDTCLIKIMVIDLVNTDGLYRKRIHFQYLNCPNSNDYWIEGIGYQYGIVKKCFQYIGPPNLRLVCYYENDVLKYKNPFYTTCSAIWVNTDEMQTAKHHSPVLKYLGNASYGIELLLLITDIKVFSITAQEILHVIPKAYSYELNLNNLSEGIYVLRIQTDSGSYVMKLLR